MKTLVKIIILLAILFVTSGPVLATDFDYPDSNDCVYPEYEVNIVTDFSEKLQEIIFQSRKGFNDGPLIDYILNYNYNLILPNKLYSAYIILPMANSLEKHTYDLTNNEKVKNFIEANENSNVFDDNNIWKKFLTWIFMRKSNKGAVVDFQERRIKILESIIANNQNFACLASYILVCVEYPKLHSQYDVVLKDIKALKAFVDKYPDSEFAAKISVIILNKLIYIKDYNSALKQCQDILNKYKNFYTGISDLYFDVYAEMLQMYKETNDQEKTIFFINKLNKKSKCYKNIVEYYSKM